MFKEKKAALERSGVKKTSVKGMTLCWDLSGATKVS